MDYQHKMNGRFGRALMITALALLILDAVITVAATDSGTARESNPLFSASAGDPLLMFACKAIVFIFAIAGSWLLRDRESIMFGPYFLIIGMYLITDMNNLLVLMHG